MAEADRAGAIDVVDMHTGGEPLRIVTAGYPAIPGADILAKRRYAREHLDHLRRFLMFEPRGHDGMYGAVLVPPSRPDADLAVLFLHNEGYSTMCGHAIMALGRFAVDRGLVSRVAPETRVAIECPCGLVVAHVAVDGDRSGAVWFESVPAFVLGLDVPVAVPGLGPVDVDIAFGGAFYAFVPDSGIGVDVRTTRPAAIAEAATAVTEAVRSHVDIRHPEEEDLSFLYGTIVTDGGNGWPEPSRNVCVFADAQIDRSPTGSGVTARLAIAAARNATAEGRVHRFDSLTGATFTGRILAATRCGPHPAWRIAVGGHAHYSGEARYWLEDDDTVGRGFRLA